MKKIWALLLLVVTAYSAFSADGDAKPRFRRVYIGFSATPEATYRWLHHNFVPAGNSETGVQGTADYGNKHTFPEVGVNVAARVGVNLTHWLAIESGVGYSLIRYRYKSDVGYSSDVYDGAPYSANTNFATTDKENYHYMTIPLGLRLSMGHRAVRFIIAPGVDFDFLLKRQAFYTYTYADGTSTTNSTTQYGNNFKTFNLSPYLGLGIDCYLSPAAVLRIMPVAQIQAFKNINTPVTEYLWNFGLNVSFLFGL